MSIHFLPVTHVFRTQLEAYQRAAWFVWECIERENLLTLRAWSASMPAAAPSSAAVLHPFALLLLGPHRSVRMQR